MRIRLGCGLYLRIYGMYYTARHLDIIQYFLLKYIKCTIIKYDKRKVECVAEKV
jgi:hypothetical protein